MKGSIEKKNPMSNVFMSQKTIGLVAYHKTPIHAQWKLKAFLQAKFEAAH